MAKAAVVLKLAFNEFALLGAPACRTVVPSISRRRRSANMGREGAWRRGGRQQLIDRLFKLGYQQIVVKVGLRNEDTGLALLEIFRVLQKRLHASNEPTWVFLVLGPVILDQHFSREYSRRFT